MAGGLGNLQPDRVALCCNAWAGHGDIAARHRLLHEPPFFVQLPPAPAPDEVCIQQIGRFDRTTGRQKPPPQLPLQFAPERVPALSALSALVLPRRLRPPPPPPLLPAAGSGAPPAQILPAPDIAPPIAYPAPQLMSSGPLPLQSRAPSPVASFLQPPPVVFPPPPCEWAGESALPQATQLLPIAVALPLFLPHGLPSMWPSQVGASVGGTTSSLQSAAKRKRKYNSTWVRDETRSHHSNRWWCQCGEDDWLGSGRRWHGLGCAKGEWLSGSRPHQQSGDSLEGTTGLRMGKRARYTGFSWVVTD